MMMFSLMRMVNSDDVLVDEVVMMLWLTRTVSSDDVLVDEDGE